MNKTSVPVWSRFRLLIALPLMIGLTACAGAGGGTGNKIKSAPQPYDAPAQVSTSGNTLTTDNDPKKRARIRVELAANYYAQGQYEVANNEVAEALKADPSLPEAYSVRGLIYMAQQDMPKAEENFLYALKISPNNLDIKNNYGYFLCQNSRVAEALPLFEAAGQSTQIQVASKAFVNAGMCSVKMHDFKSAERYFSKAFEIEPSNPFANYHLANLYLKKGDIERARFYAGRINQGNNVTPTPESLVLGIRIERAAGDAASETVYATKLKRLFPNSRQALALERGDLLD